MMGTFLLLMKAFSVHDAQAEAGMIPMSSPVGEIGGRGHWYSLRTMKGELYWTDPAYSSDVRRNDDGSFSFLGEPPVSVVLVLHPLWYEGEEPWRQAIDWMRQAEQMYRNSGVPVRFIIEGIYMWDDMPDTVEEAYHAMYFDKYAAEGADLVIGLKPYMAGDPYCGIAGVGGRLSVSSCSPKTLAHELGHNFGLKHAHQGGYEGRKGYCIDPYPSAKECTKGTLMSYSGNGRLPLFAANGFTKDGDPIGDEEHTAVEYLRSKTTDKAIAYELSQNEDVATDRMIPEEISLCYGASHPATE
jgi:hypothetical protein